MFEIYIQDYKKFRLGFTFYLFENSKFVIDYSEYATKTDMDWYLRTSKSDILGLNLDKFIIFCDKSAVNKTVLIEEAIVKLRKAAGWRVKNKGKYIEFVEMVDRGKSLLYDLVNAQDKESKGKAMVMCLMITSFIQKEIDANKIV